MPLWKDVGEFFANEIGYETNDPIDAISNFVHKHKRPRAIEHFAQLLHKNDDRVKPGKAHYSFARLGFQNVITTNFDFLLEQAYAERNHRFQTVTSDTQLSVDFSDPENKITRLLKIHGDLDHPAEMIITENDYDTYLENRPLMSTHISNLLMTKTPLFIGYSLNDPDFRGLWQVIRSRLGDHVRQAYAIVPKPDAGTITRFDRRGVHVIAI